jgi:hypothetical protein
VVFVDRKPSYLEALQRADEGQTRPLIRFFRERAIETMLLIDDNLRAAKAPALQEVTTSFATLHAERAGLSFQAQDNIALHLLAEVSNQIKVRFEQLHVSGVSLQTLEGRSAQKAPEGYRRIAEAPWKAFNVAIESRYPAPATINSSFHVIIQTDNDSYFAFRVVAADWNLDVRLEDIYPATSTSFQLRLDSWLDGILRTLLARLAEAGKRAYREILDR